MAQVSFARTPGPGAPGARGAPAAPVEPSSPEQPRNRTGTMKSKINSRINDFFIFPPLVVKSPLKLNSLENEIPSPRYWCLEPGNPCLLGCHLLSGKRKPGRLIAIGNACRQNRALVQIISGSKPPNIWVKEERCQLLSNA